MHVFMNWYTGIFFLLLCTACGNGATDLQEIGPEQPELRTAPVLREDLHEYIRGMGMVRARQEADLCAEISARVLHVHRDIGDDVISGDLIVELESEGRLITLEKKRAQLDKAAAQYKKTERDRIKADSLFKGGILSDTDYDSATLDAAVSDADLQLARAELRAAEKEYRDTKITAPYSGTIALRSVEVGHFVTPGQSLLTLVDLTGITVVINISERDIAKISTECPVSVEIDSLPAETFTGTIHTIARKADDTSRSFPVEVWVENPHRRILPGMIARVSIRSARPEPRLTIPHSAVSSVHGETIVRIMADGEPVMCAVDLGSVMGDRVIVRSGLKEGQQVVLPAVM
jgi:membrane fusion protein, multidrug efflux system